MAGSAQTKPKEAKFAQFIHIGFDHTGSVEVNAEFSIDVGIRPEQVFQE